MFVLIDSRHPPQKKDIQFIELLGHHKVPFAIVFTKTDKLPETELKKNISNYEKELLKHWEFLPNSFNSSIKKKIGKNEILDFIEGTNKSLRG